MRFAMLYALLDSSDSSVLKTSWPDLRPVRQFRGDGRRHDCNGSRQPGRRQAESERAPLETAFTERGLPGRVLSARVRRGKPVIMQSTQRLSGETGETRAKRVVHQIKMSLAKRAGLID